MIRYSSVRKQTSVYVILILTNLLFQMKILNNKDFHYISNMIYGWKIEISFIVIDCMPCRRKWYGYQV